MAKRTLNRALIVKDRNGGNRLVKANKKESRQIRAALKGLYTDSGVQKPPYDFQALAELLTLNTAHYRASKQKAADVAGLGWDLTPEDGLDPESPEVKAERERLTEFLRRPNPKMTLREVLEAVAFDYEAFGWGFIELVLNGSDEPVEINHLPGHTVRAHKDGNKYVQVRGQEKVWFLDIATANIWGENEEEPRKFIDAETGEVTEEEPEDSGNVVIPFIHYTPLSSFYGLPDYIPAVGAIAANKALADFNLGFISHNTVPHYAVVVQGAELDEELEDDILSYFRDHVKGQSRATLVLPIPYADEEVKVTFEKLGGNVSDGNFLNLKDSNTVEVLMAHGVPPYRVAWAIMGSLGGNLGHAMDEIYKNAVVESRQDVIEDRFNRYVIRGALQALRHEWKLTDLDLTDRKAELDLGVRAVEFGLLTPAEAREDVLGKERGDAPDEFFISSSLVRVNEPTPTEEEAEAAQFKRMRREARGDLMGLRDEVRETLNLYKQMSTPPND